MTNDARMAPSSVTSSAMLPFAGAPKGGTALADPITTRAALWELAVRYASALDRVNPSALADLFCADGSVEIYDPGDAGEPVRTFRGHEQLAILPTLTGAYSRTFHFLGNVAYDIGEKDAVGEVYCIAHHLTSAKHGGTNLATYIRYDDQYSLGVDEVWRFRTRRIRVDWHEIRLTSTWHLQKPI